MLNFLCKLCPHRISWNSKAICNKLSMHWMVWKLLTNLGSVVKSTHNVKNPQLFLFLEWYANYSPKMWKLLTYPWNDVEFIVYFLVYGSRHNLHFRERICYRMYTYKIVQTQFGSIIEPFVQSEISVCLAQIRWNNSRSLAIFQCEHHNISESVSIYQVCYQ